AIIISDRNAHAISPTWHTSLLGDVGECSVSIIVVESIAKRRIRREKIAVSAVHQVDVHPAIIVIVDKAAASTSGLGQVIVGRAPVHVTPGDSTFLRRDLCEKYRNPSLRPEPDGAKVCPA